ncbi:MAG: hypothetical protein QOE58_2784 [Actinomycetota bacterium]|nr:hypothetical protein [Actinomycetota bacterium]
MEDALEEVATGDGVRTALMGDPHRPLDGSTGASGGGHRSLRRRGPSADANSLFDLVPGGGKGDPGGPQRLGHGCVRIIEQPEEDVLGADPMVAKARGLDGSRVQDPPSLVGKAVQRAERGRVHHGADRYCRGPGPSTTRTAGRFSTSGA